MTHLRRQDLQSLSEVLRAIYAVSDLPEFPERVLPEILRVLPSDFIGYRAVDPPTAISRGRFWPPGVVHDMASKEKIFERHWHEHPVLTRHIREGDGQALRISDFLTQRQFHQLGLYHELYRTVDVEDVLAMVLHVRAPGGLSIAFHRHGPSFSERDREIANLLRPHLSQAYLNARAATEMHAALKSNRESLETIDQGVIVLAADGHIQLATPKARRWVGDYFGSPRQGERLTDALDRWVKSQEALLASADEVPAPREPLVVERGDRSLVVRFIKEPTHITLLLDERGIVASARSLEALGLTCRQAQVLVWVSEGKTNAEIGVILGARPRTVAKHLERIFQKLGVETRTAAANVALSVPRLDRH